MAQRGLTAAEVIVVQTSGHTHTHTHTHTEAEVNCADGWIFEKGPICVIVSRDGFVVGVFGRGISSSAVEAAAAEAELTPGWFVACELETKEGAWQVLWPFTRAGSALELLIGDDCVEGVVPERGGDSKTWRKSKGFIRLMSFFYLLIPEICVCVCVCVRFPVLTCPLVFKVVLDVVGLQAVHVRAPLRRAVVKVVVDHVVHHVAAESPDEQGRPEDLWERVLQEDVETPHHQGGQAGGEDQPGAVKRRLGGKDQWVEHREEGIKKLSSSSTHTNQTNIRENGNNQYKHMKRHVLIVKTCKVLLNLSFYHHIWEFLFDISNTLILQNKKMQRKCVCFNFLCRKSLFFLIQVLYIWVFFSFIVIYDKLYA